MKNIYLLIVLFFCYISGVWGQSTEENITPLSPKAASFLKYGTYPVSLHTGLVDISVPIYSITTDETTIPIELKYHASGIKFDDVDMEAGLGWSLNAGGVITRVIRGSEDGKHERYFRDITKIKTCNDSSPLDNGYESLREVENGSRNEKNKNNSIRQKDGEFDMFHFSFLGQSGSFCFPPTESIVEKSAPSTGLFIPINGMQAYQRSNLKIELVNPDGVSYTFESKGYDHNGQFAEYYLTKLISANRSDTIIFSYDTPSDLSIKKPIITYSHTISNTVALKGFPGSGSSTKLGKEYSDTGGTSIRNTNPQRLTKISFKGGYINFEYLKINNLQTWKLKTIKIYNNIQDSPLQIISLVKSKFNNQKDRLDKVEFWDSTERIYEYQFKYKGEPNDILSNKTNNIGIDYWGYFNDAYVPSGKGFIPKYDGIDKLIPSVIRDANESAMQKGILETIIYPTKGYTTFTYEAHKAYWGGKSITYGGLRIKEINNYLANGSLAEKKWFEYGNGISCTPPNPNNFIEESRTIITAIAGLSDPFPAALRTVTTHLSSPKQNNLVSGSSVVYDKVTEYIGNKTENIGYTIYTYDVNLNEEFERYSDTYRWDSPNEYKRNYEWKSGQLKSKEIYKKAGTTYQKVYSLRNTYDDINVTEFRNLRVLPYVYFEYDMGSLNRPDISKNFCNYKEWRELFNPSHLTPYNYFNYYTTSGIRVLKNTEETKDGVTSYTQYDSYNENGLPTKVHTISSAGEEFTTHYKYPTDFTSTVYTGMKVRNILTPKIEVINYKGQNQLLTKTTTNYKLWHSKFFEPESIQSSYPDGSTEIRSRYSYNSSGKLQEVIKYDSKKKSYLWGYNNLYPIMEINNASYTDVISKIPEITLSAISKKERPSYEDWQLLNTLRDKLPNSQITVFEYNPLVGLNNVKNPNLVQTRYTYDRFGRLNQIHEAGDLLEQYDYNYSIPDYKPMTSTSILGKTQSKPGENVYFTTSVLGGSGQYSYSWEIRSSTGSLHYSTWNQSGDLSYTFYSEGGFIVSCKVKDEKTGKEVYTENYIQVVRVLQFENIQKSTNYVEATIPIGGQSIDATFYITFSGSPDNNIVADFQIGRNEYKFYKSTGTISKTVTLSSGGATKISIRLSGGTKGPSDAQLYLSTSSSGIIGNDNVLKVSLNQ